jgi:hypothetical protein
MYFCRLSDIKLNPISDGFEVIERGANENPKGISSGG